MWGGGRCDPSDPKPRSHECVAFDGNVENGGYAVSGVLGFGILFWIGHAAEEHFVREEDSKTVKTVKRLGMLAVWCIAVAVLAGRAGVGV